MRTKQPTTYTVTVNGVTLQSRAAYMDALILASMERHQTEARVNVVRDHDGWLMDSFLHGERVEILSNRPIYR